MVGRERLRAGVALEEALKNAYYQGNLEVGATLEAPEIQASHAGACTIQVDFDSVDAAEPDTLYEVWIGGRAQPELVAGGGRGAAFGAKQRKGVDGRSR